MRLIKNQVDSQCRVWNLYGPAETTIACTFHLTDLMADQTDIPIGQSLPNYRCLVLDEYSQMVIVGQEGELVVGGVGVFAGYLGRDDLTKKTLIHIDNEVFYRTGDLVWIDNCGCLHYVGRKDHQVKIRGQRIELDEIERCLLETTISACIVLKYEEHLVAYVQSTNAIEKHLREHCRSRLPPFMVPSTIIMLEQFPLNNNGKVDRKCLPLPNFSTQMNNEATDSLPLTNLEKHLHLIFAQAFHVQSPNVNMSFEQMGGTSLDVIGALTLIRREICSKVHVGLLFENPSVRQLAQVIEPLLMNHEQIPMKKSVEHLNNDERRPMPCLFIEILGIFLLALQWLYPIYFIYHSNYLCTLIGVPLIHILSYAAFQRLFCRLEMIKKVDALYSLSYYGWWFLDRLWSINNSYWLQYLIGTPVYNWYLRLCGAQIANNAHIYTTWIDAPWLLEVGESTYIGNETILSSLSYHDQTYELHRISIGSCCSINVRCVLFDEVQVDNHVHVEPMSAVTGCISASAHHLPIEIRSLSRGQTFYQLACLLCLISIHYVLMNLTYLLYQRCLVLCLPLFLCLAFSWFFWSVACLLISILLLKFLVGNVVPGRYRLNSYYYLHKLWLRQLIISLFQHSFVLVPPYGTLSAAILRWMGAHVENDVKLAEFSTLLQFPSNLLSLETGTTTFGKAMLVPFEMTETGDCCLEHIFLGSNTNLGNGCTLMPSIRLAPSTMVGNFTLITRKTNYPIPGCVLLGIPARRMPFGTFQQTTSTSDSSSYLFLRTCLFFLSVNAWSLLYIHHCLLLSRYWFIQFSFV